MRLYKYWGYGLHISSEIEFPELLPVVFEKAEVTVRLGEVPRTVRGVHTSGKLLQYEFNQNELLLTVTGVARYYTANGSHMIVAPNEGVQISRSTRIYALASAMAGILLQRNLLPLHASAIKTNNGLVIITGHSGAGKSTTLAGLIKNGHEVFSDDILVLNRFAARGPVLATASYPMIKLWGNSITALNHPQFQDRSFPILPGMDKYGMFFHSTFDTTPRSIVKIFCLKAANVKQIICNRLTGVPAFQQLSEQIYRPVLLQDPMLRELSFQILTALLQQCEVYELIRPLNGEPDTLIEFIETLLL